MARANVDSLVEDMAVVRLAVATLWVVRIMLYEHQPTVHLPWSISLGPEADLPLEGVVHDLGSIILALAFGWQSYCGGHF
jgi:hypothetical protein